MADRKLSKEEALERLKDPRRFEVFRAADELRAEGKERVALRNVWARVKRNAGVAGTNKLISDHLADWAKERSYSPVIELSGIPDRVSAHIAKAGVEIWKAAQTEAAMVLERERRRMEEAVATERELRSEAMGMIDARDAVIEAQRKELVWYADELERMKGHVHAVRAREFWRRVAQEIWEILPEREALHLNDIAEKLGREIVKEAEEYPGEWGAELLRGVMDQRVKFRKLFAAEGSSRYRRRRPEDDAA